MKRAAGRLCGHPLIRITLLPPRGYFRGRDIRVLSAVEAGVAVACTYESVSLLSGKRIAPISHLCYRHPWLTPVVLTGLGAHLAFGER